MRVGAPTPHDGGVAAQGGRRGRSGEGLEAGGGGSGGGGGWGATMAGHCKFMGDRR